MAFLFSVSLCLCGELFSAFRTGAIMFPALLLASTLLGAEPEDAKKFFTIQVVGEQSRRGVPLVELRTVHGVRYWTDSNGLVAIHEPGLMGKDVFFHVSSHGYEYPKDGFGFRG